MNERNNALAKPEVTPPAVAREHIPLHALEHIPSAGVDHGTLIDGKYFFTVTSADQSFVLHDGAVDVFIWDFGITHPRSVQHHWRQYCLRECGADRFIVE